MVFIISPIVGVRLSRDERHQRRQVAVLHPRQPGDTHPRGVGLRQEGGLEERGPHHHGRRRWGRKVQVQQAEPEDDAEAQSKQ